MPVTLSSEINPEIREYERTSTTVVNAYVQPLVGNYLRELEYRLNEIGYRRPLYVMLSSGGLSTAEYASSHPVEILESGPAGGVVLAAQLSERVGMTHSVAFDMGGTTAKVCVIDDYVPSKTEQFEVARLEWHRKGSGLPVRAPMVDMIEIGTGGGSVASVDALGLIKVGPHSAGSHPGPACYGLGGIEPTVTDANLVLGLLDPEFFLGGKMSVYSHLAVEAIQRVISEPLGISVLEAARGIREVANENMATAARLHMMQSGASPEDYNMICMGGAGPLHAFDIAQRLGMSRIVCPQQAGVASAMGFLRAPMSVEVAEPFEIALSQFDAFRAQELETRITELSTRATENLRAAAVPVADIQIKVQISMRYRGQGHGLQVQLDSNIMVDQRTLEGAFAQSYQRVYGNTNEHLPTEITEVRVTAFASAPSLPEMAVLQPCVYAGNGSDALVHLRLGDLAIGTWIPGPVLVHLSETTVHVGDGGAVTLDHGGNIVADIFVNG
jgi:N-methylhydantoinase A